MLFDGIRGAFAHLPRTQIHAAHASLRGEGYECSVQCLQIPLPQVEQRFREDDNAAPLGRFIRERGNLRGVREILLDTPKARTKMSELSAASQLAMIPRPFRRKFSRVGPPPPPGYDEDWNPNYPWQWSAGVLGGVFILSAGILSSRVKTLDRLK